MDLPTNPQPDNIRVTHDIPKKQVNFKLQGLVLSALMSMAADRKESIPQLLKSIIEQRLHKDGYLPEWYFQRKL